MCSITVCSHSRFRAVWWLCPHLEMLYFPLHRFLLFFTYFFHSPNSCFRNFNVSSRFLFNISYDDEALEYLKLACGESVYICHSGEHVDRFSFFFKPVMRHCYPEHFHCPKHLTATYRASEHEGIAYNSLLHNKFYLLLWGTYRWICSVTIYLFSLHDYVVQRRINHNYGDFNGNYVGIDVDKARGY